MTTTHRTRHATIRVCSRNPNHHLFRNNGTWWIHYTRYPSPATAERVRESLRTRSVELARKRRDAHFQAIFGGYGREVAS